MNVQLFLTSNATAAPANIKAAWTTAANMIDAALTDAITVNIQVDWTGTGGGASAGPSSGGYLFYHAGIGAAPPYVYDYLTGNASPGDTTFASLPNFLTISGQQQVIIWRAQEKLMGVISGTDIGIDATSTFATDIPASSMVGVALHEFGHAMGRVPFADGSGGVGGSPDIFDFFRYTAPGTRLINGNNTAPAAYFSLNGGNTRWFDYGQTSDPSDFLNTPGSLLSPEDPYNEFYDGGTIQSLTPADLEQMDALGYHLTKNSPAADGHDFNGDSSADILLQSGGGQTLYANMANGVFNSFVNVANTPGYNVMGAGKISGNASSDVVLEDGSGHILYANLANGALSNYVSVASTPGFNVVGVGDINNDHHADVVIQNPGNGQTYYVNMAGGAPSGFVGAGTTPGFTVDAVADINGDGNADIVIENASGAIDYVNMHNGVFSGYGAVATTAGFNVVGAGDINRDGYADIVIQNPTSGAIDYINMKNGVFNGFVAVATVPGWKVTAVEDVLNNGFDDIVIQNQTNGQVDYINMTTGTFQGFVVVAGVPGYTGHTDPTNPDNAPSTPLSALDPSIYAGATLGPQIMYDNTLNANDTAAGALGAPADPHWMPLVGV